MQITPRSNRRGATTVEFAITAGIALMLFFASFEFCRIAMIRHTVDNAVYEAARSGIIPGATSSEVKNRATNVLKTLGLRNAKINVSPNRLGPGVREVTVEIEVPFNQNSFGTTLFMKNKKVVRSLTMQREVNS